MRTTDLASALGVVLKKHRQAASLSQEALAEKAGIHPTHISLIERCERNPSVNVAKALAMGLNVRLASLVKEAEELLEERGR